MLSIKIMRNIADNNRKELFYNNNRKELYYTLLFRHLIEQGRLTEEEVKRYIV